MDEALTKLLIDGVLTAPEADKVSTLQPGVYVIHKSWGFGKVSEWRLQANQILIDFEGKPGHAMQPKYAAATLTAVTENHILALRHNDIEGLKALLKTDPISVLRTTLQSYGGKIMLDEIQKILVPRVQTEAEYKRWWENAKKLLKKDGHFNVPAKKTQPLELREQALSRTEELLTALAGARQLKQQMVVVDDILKSLDEFEDADKLQQVVNALEITASQQTVMNPSTSVEALLAREDIFAKKGEGLSQNEELSVVTIVRSQENKLPELFEGLPAAKQRPVLAKFPEAFPDRWVNKLVGLLHRLPSRLVGDIAKLLSDHRSFEPFLEAMTESIRTNTATPEMLYWVSKEREGLAAELRSPEVIKATLAALEMDLLAEYRKGTKLQNLLFDDIDLIQDLLLGADKSHAREILRRLKISPAFDEPTRRSLLARIVKLHPDLGSIITGEEVEKQDHLVVSWESLETRQKELENLIQKKIPANTEEIRIAREYGDLRENFEYKAAKQMQGVLLRRKSELEADLGRAKGTDFTGADTSVVSIGTVVTIDGGGEKETYTILGAWDSIPEKNVISYLTTIGQSVLGQKVGQTVELPTESGPVRKAKIVSIEAYKK
jgi:transcription elongation GreA/GreB family factor